MIKRLLLGNKGMSLIELMIVLIIMGMIAGIVGRSLMSRLSKAKVQSATLQMKAFQTALGDYYLDNGMYPTTEQGLEALIQKPGSGPEPTSYSPEGYLDKGELPKDSWGNDYMYESDGAKYSIMSYGADRKEGGSGYDKDLIVEQ
ncbi:MAG: type II secretion system major pseudopilin GspG [Oligoflexia bacterium]|nr:type II secretion system major pseudopilin GspG [Oligoflexia bacterium]